MRFLSIYNIDNDGISRSENGCDGQSGSLEAPLKTISAAAALHSRVIASQFIKELTANASIRHGRP